MDDEWDQETELAVDRRYVDVSDFHEIRYWADVFDVSVDELRLAIGNVGNDPERIRHYLDAR